MNLIDENEEKEQAESKKKILKIILISIAVLVFLAIILIVFSVVKNNNTLKLQINGKNAELQSGFVLMADKKNILIENGQMYISVRKLVSALGGEYYNDEYKNKGEDTTKCYIKTSTNSNEYTSYISNSSQIYKASMLMAQDEEASDNTNNTTQNKTKKDDSDVEKTVEYEYFNIENGVKYIDGEIYASKEAIELGFNVIMTYNEKNKTISIYTLDTLETVAAKNVNLAVIGDNCEYYNKKLLKYGLVLIQNSAGDYGIANYNNYQEGNYIVSCKYSNIRFCESSGTVIVTTSEDGTAITKLLDKGCYFIKEVESGEWYLLNDNTFEAEIKEHQEIVSVEITNESEKPDVDIEKTGIIQTTANQEIRYDFHIKNAGNVKLNHFNWYDYLPTDYVRITKLITGTYNQDLNYSIYYKTNKNDYKLLKDNLNTQVNNYIDFSKLELEADEYVTEFKADFGTVDVGFESVINPYIFVRVNSNVQNDDIFTNKTRIEGYNKTYMVWDEDDHTTKLYEKEVPVKKLPRTGM